MQPKYCGHVNSEGVFSIIDPDYDALELIRAIHPHFGMKSEPPPDSYIPVLERTKKLTSADLCLDDLDRLETGALWEIHDRLLKSYSTRQAGEVSLLDLKVELASRALLKCRLCGCECGVNRFQTPGRCHLKDEGFYQSIYVHIAEEPPITPCLVVKLYGCALRCKGCQAFDVLPVPSGAKCLGPGVWQEARRTTGFDQAVALEWVGGNPDESLYPILYALQFTRGLSLPIVWNNHGYGAQEVYRLLEGVADVYVMDFKFGKGNCCEEVAGINDYWKFATAGLEQATKQNAGIIIRILVMPGHVHCCHEPSLKWLSRYRHRLWMSFLEFIPMWKAASDPQLKRGVSTSELAAVRAIAKDYGLRDIDETPGQFWSIPSTSNLVVVPDGR
jgi:putative pyruvate formate lyase activating enzyme